MSADGDTGSAAFGSGSGSPDGAGLGTECPCASSPVPPASVAVMSLRGGKGQPADNGGSGFIVTV